ncbi:MAG: DNA repair protein RecN [Flavobacteriaceae bacterium]|nr:DNA repair protein RecN [Flavobacteriaceae bacterium]
MITHISIKNFALIDDISISVNQGFTVITGETGSGKSILLGALGLVLGERADLDAIKDKSKKCVIEVLFSIKNYQLTSIFKELEMDYEDESIIRREILPSGKSRAFVNDSPVKLQLLKKLGVRLIDIHSQHETLAIGQKEVQYKCVDHFANNKENLNLFQQEYNVFTHLKNQLLQLTNKQTELNQAHDYNLFLLNELDEAQLSEGLQEKLEEQQQELSHVELLKEQLSKALQITEEEEVGSLEQLRETYHSINQLSPIKPIYKELAERIKSIQIELEDIVMEMNRQVDQIEDDPQLLEDVNIKLNKIYQLQKKHQATSVEELMQINSSLADQVLEKDQLSDEIEKINKQISLQHSNLLQQAEQLYKNRKKAIPKLEEELKTILSRIGMPDATFKLELITTKSLSNYGMDDLRWKFSANKGSLPKPIEKVASGGELSRITLAVKRILAKNSKLPSIVFDEIDTGVSGDIGSKIGEILAEMGNQMQVISISHLPQLAAQAQHHLKVFKTVQNETTSTKISQLTEEERITEIVSMLGADTNTKSAVEHAKSLLNR